MEVLATSRLLRREDKQLLTPQFNWMGRLGLVTIKDVMLVSQRRFIAFWTTRSPFRIPRGYTFIWDKLQELLSLYEPVPDLDGGSKELDWMFVRNRRLNMISTNDAYHKLIDKHKLMEERVIKWVFVSPLLNGFMWSRQVGVLDWCYQLGYSFGELLLEIYH